MDDRKIKPDDLPNAIRSIRGRLGLTQSAFAKRVLALQTSVSRWESGALKPDVGRLVELFYLAQGEDETAPIIAALVSLGVPVPNLASATQSTDRTSAAA